LPLLLFLIATLDPVSAARGRVAGQVALLSLTLISALAARAGPALEASEGVELFGREDAPDA
jgi:hypothetical protein